MESWKSGSQMTRTIDLRHWAHRGDIVPRCRDRTFSALEGSVPMTVPLESGSAACGTRLAQLRSITINLSAAGAVLRKPRQRARQAKCVMNSAP
jgi:hypothetical protein